MAPQTGVAPLDWLLSLLDSWGYLIVIGITISENLFLIGSLTPGDVVVMAGGFVSERGGLNAWFVWMSSMLGTIIGSNLSYWFGRRGGRGALLKWGGRFVNEERLIAAEEYFEIHGDKTVLIARFAVGFKNWVPVIAGISRMRIWVFEIYTFIGALLCSALMVTLGRIFAENFDRAIEVASNITWVGLVVVVAMFVFLLWGRRKLISRKTDLLVEVAEIEKEGDVGVLLERDGDPGQGQGARGGKSAGDADA